MRPSFVGCIVWFIARGFLEVQVAGESVKPGCMRWAKIHPNTKLTCDFSYPSSCIAQCTAGYSLASGSTEGTLSCTDGEWHYGQERWNTYKACQPKCLQGCGYGGTCVAPNLCQCSKGLSGKTCSKRACTDWPEVPMSSSLNCKGSNCIAKCGSGYSFIPGVEQMDYACDDGQWTVRTPGLSVSSSCKPHCNQGCGHGGTCVGPNMCRCSKGWEGKTCTQRTCTGWPKAPWNSYLSCKGSKCNAKCNVGYNLIPGVRQMDYACADGQWIVSTPGLSTSSFCKAHCDDGCGKSGTCVAPNRCRCPQGLNGLTCSQRSCTTWPTAPRNSHFSCQGKKCTSKCITNHRFAPGIAQMELLCNDGEWIVNTPGLSKYSNCTMMCRSPCQNGGRCISPGRCSCPDNYGGPQCQNVLPKKPCEDKRYPRSHGTGCSGPAKLTQNRCNIRRTGYNGGYNCALMNGNMECQLTGCSSGYYFNQSEGTTNDLYTCNSNTGEWVPKVPPKCIRRM